MSLREGASESQLGRNDDDVISEAARRDALEGEVVVLARLGEVEEADDARVVEAAHDLDLLEDVGALLRERRERTTTASGKDGTRGGRRGRRSETALGHDGDDCSRELEVARFEPRARWQWDEPRWPSASS